MKSVLLSITALLFSHLIFAQCSGPRYNTKVFQVDTISNLVYGSNLNSSGLQQDLLFDIYLPKADACKERPVLVLAHGGTFLVGNKDIIDVKILANEFAKRGYVCVSMNYRLGIKIIGGGSLQEEFANAVWRGMQDGRAMIRHLRKTAALQNNPYGIDTNRIYLGGSSAGAVLALQVAFLDQASEVPSFVDTLSLGGLSGDSGSRGYSSRISGIINLCGGMPIGIEPMRNNTTVPLLHVHGTRDNVVPYKCDSFDFQRMNVELMCGSYTVDSFAKVNGNQSKLYTMTGESHVPWLNSNGLQLIPGKAFLLDSAERLIEEFLYSQVVAVEELPDISLNARIQVKSGSVLVALKEGPAMFSMYDLSGRLLIEKQLKKGANEIELSGGNSGIVLVRIISREGKTFSRKILLTDS